MNRFDIGTAVGLRLCLLRWGTDHGAEVCAATLRRAGVACVVGRRSVLALGWPEDWARPVERLTRHSVRARLGGRPPELGGLS